MLMNKQKSQKSIPLISVVLPVYNCEEHICEAIESILSQTFSDFELIIIDDGSTDKTLKNVQAIANGDERIRLITRPNRGLVASLNQGIDIARGVWIARMDADDIALPNRFERQLEWLLQTSAQMCGSWVRRFGSSDKRVVRLPQSDEAIKVEMLFSCPFAHPTMMIKTSILQAMKYDSKWNSVEDYELWTRAAIAGTIMTNVPEVLLLYRVHKSQISTVNSHAQIQRTDDVRRNYWNSVHQLYQLNNCSIEEVLKIGQAKLTNVNVDIVDNLIIGLLKVSEGEAKERIMMHALRMYYKIAAQCPDIISRWKRLSDVAGERVSLFVKFKLFLLKTLKITSQSGLYGLLRKVHISLFRRT